MSFQALQNNPSPPNIHPSTPARDELIYHGNYIPKNRIVTQTHKCLPFLSFNFIYSLFELSPLMSMQSSNNIRQTTEYEIQLLSIQQKSSMILHE